MPKFVPRQRKHKVLARQRVSNRNESTEAIQQDTNAAHIVPLSKDEREAKRQKLREELRAQQSKMSAKKQKRLDKYIENKLRKDEQLDLVRKLEKEKAKWDARGLDGGKPLRKRTFDDFSNISNGRVVSRIEHSVVAGDDLLSEDSLEDNAEAFDDATVSSLKADQKQAIRQAFSEQGKALTSGSGLAKPLEMGADGLPVIQVRNRKKGKTSDDLEAPIKTDVEELPWEGFDSECDDGGAYDTSSELESTHDLSNSSDDATDDDDIDQDTDNNEEGNSDEETSDSDTNTSIASGEQTRIKPRASAFKAWATQQLNQAIGHTPFYDSNSATEPVPPITAQDHQNQAKAPPFETRNLVNGLPELTVPAVDRQVYSVHVKRTEYIQEARVQLPILQREQEIMEAIYANPVVVIKGETGSGKTTQLPQFLYEAGYGDPTGPTPGMIGITQPRRVAAVSMAKRVSEELGDHGSKVAHQIRFDSSVSSETAMKFMTDGILLRELSQDLLLRKYSVIIIDEAHERSINTDILVGMLSKIVPARLQKTAFNPNPTPLKLIIMSATLDIQDFLHPKLFAPSLKPAMVEAEGRQHRVTMHFALRSRADYLEEVVEKVKRAHRKLPKGGILVFLTGQNEIRQVQNRLARDIAQSSEHVQTLVNQPKMHLAASETPLEMEDLDFGSLVVHRPDDDEDEINILTNSDEEAEDGEFDISDDEPEDASQTSPTKVINDKRDPYDTVRILPLYSQLPTKEQLRVFEPTPERSRVIVLATNVAETSLTIPGIRYVFDCGRSKERRYDLDTGVQRFEIDYISKASAQQRAGRAGRTGPGHCWRLYTSAVYEQYFSDHTEPEILRAPAESVVLQIKGIGYPKPIVEFPFPTPPSLQTLDTAERVLRGLGALSMTGGVSELGKELAIYPLAPRLGKILASAVKKKDVLVQAVSMVAGLAVGDIYVNDNVVQAGDEHENDYHAADQDQKKQEYGRVQALLSRHDKLSDGLKLATAISMFEVAEDKEEFCEQHFVKSKAMREIFQLYQQLWSIVSANHPEIQRPARTNRSKLSSADVKSINRIAASGYIDQVAIRWDCAPTPPMLSGKPRRAIDVPYLPLIPLSNGISRSTSSDLTQYTIFIHPSSVLSRLPTKDLPPYIVYTHLQQAQARTIVSATDSQQQKIRMYPLTTIDAATLAHLAKDTALLAYGKPIPKMPVEEVVLPGQLGKQRICWVSAELKGGAAAIGSYGWPLPPMKVRQAMDLKSRSGWRVVEVLS